ncbi:hypothetical protein [Rhodoblastus sp.]|uniref:hypothetical protein n=1 Tax=Rhodoblastus sp. TaxID=1962975 RepID=UPI0035B06978
MSSPWDDRKITSPATRLIRCASDPLVFWIEELRNLGLVFDETDGLAYWNLLSAIYALTEEERVKLRATDAYPFAGCSPTTGKRKLIALIRANLILTTRNPARRNEKFVVVSGEAKTAILRTLDRWASNWEAETAVYRQYRRSDHRPNANA